jgi:hypothetical protein
MGGEPASPSPVGLEEPPRAGAGSGRDAWAEYAKALQLEVPVAAGRDDIIDLVDASR